MILLGLLDFRYMLKLYKNKKLILIFIVLTAFSFFEKDNNLYSQTTSSLEKIESNFNSQIIEFKSEYLLGPGDQIFIQFEGINLFSRVYNINPDGFLNLPELNLIKAEGKTINELKLLLTNKYKDFIFEPNLNITLSIYRPISVFIGGEVNRPGIYILNYLPITEQKSNLIAGLENNKINTQLINTPLLYPKLFDALKKANGITNNAELENIKIIRKNSESQGGGKIQTNINLISVLKNGDQKQNIRLYDGDSIFVSKSLNSTLDQITSINRTNLTPEKIQIFINGNVRRPGATLVRQGSSLLTALASVGGRNDRTGYIDFIRLKKDGKSEKSRFKFDLSAQKGSKRNPILIDGDIIVVRKNILGKTKQIFEDIKSPLFSGYGLYKIFN